jgi:hypothetical protein
MGIALKCLILGVAITHAIALAPNSDEIKKAFESFKVTYNKTYKTSLEESRGFKQFVNVFHFVDAHNKKFAREEVNFDCSINRFADLPPAELKKISNGTRLPPYEL